MPGWEPAQGERSSSYRYFLQYRDMGESRSLAKLAGALGKSKQAMEQLSQRWRWQARLTAWDRDVAEREARALIEERVEAAKRHAQEGRLMQVKGVQRLNEMAHSSLTVEQATRMIDVGVSIERTAMDLDRLRVELSGPGGGPIEMSEVADDLDYSQLSDEELADLERLLAKAAARSEGHIAG